MPHRREILVSAAACVAANGSARAAIPDPDHPGEFVFAQSSADPTDNRFPPAIYNKAVAADVNVSVRFKAVAGRLEHADQQHGNVHETSFGARPDRRDDAVRQIRGRAAEIEMEFYGRRHQPSA
jgi:hypothetical protein